jgi:hypothetical protein
VEKKGYVVEKKECRNVFLTQFGYFVRRKNYGSSLGIERARVHSSESLLKYKDGGIIPGDALLHSACYDTETGNIKIEVVHSTTTYQEFLESELALHI